MTKTLTALIPALFVAALVGCNSGPCANGCCDDGEDQWQVLFDGTNFDNFRRYRGEEAPAEAWVINDDGSMQIQAGNRGNDIVTREQYSDFDLRFDWKVAEGSNSGVIYLVSEGVGNVVAEGEEDPFRQPFMTGPEYQILDDDNHPNGRNPRTRAAALYGLIACNETAQLAPVGQWNTGRILVEDGHVEHWLNGELALSYELDSPEFRALVANGWGRDWPGFALQERGHICFQDHFNDVWFRNIRIRDLSDDNGDDDDHDDDGDDDDEDEDEDEDDDD